jgi:hypothetical protein
VDKDFQYIIAYKKHKWSLAGKIGLLTYCQGRLQLQNNKAITIIDADINSIPMESCGHFGSTKVAGYYICALGGSIPDKQLDPLRESIAEFLKNHPKNSSITEQISLYESLGQKLSLGTLDGVIGTRIVGGIVAVKASVGLIDMSKMIQNSLLSAKKDDAPKLAS